MRLCQARRYAQHLVHQGTWEVDPFCVLRALPSYSLLWSGGVYLLSFYVGEVLHRRRSDCCLAVVCAAAEVVRGSMAVVQKQVHDCRGDAGLASHMQDVLDGRGVKTFAITNTRARFPSVLNRQSLHDPYSEQVEKWIADNGVDVDGYLSSREVLDDGLRTEALTMLTDSFDGPLREGELDDIVDAFIYLVASFPDYAETIPPITAERLMSIPISKAGSGAVNVDPSAGRVGGNKEEMISSAALAAMTLDVLNYEAYPKAEVLKKGKKVRQTTIEPMPIYLKSCYYTQHFVRRHGLVVNGDCNGMSRERFVCILYSWFLDEKAFNPTMSWPEFLEWFASADLCEDDKKSWEKTTNRLGGWVAALYLCSQVRISPTDIDHLAHVIAHDLCPIIKYNGDQCYAAPYKTASGKFKTLHDNTIKHLAGSMCVQIHLRRHHMGQGGCTLGCGDVTVTELDIARIVGGGKLGDDSIRISAHDGLVAKLIDHFLGSETVCETLPSQKAEFLRTKFKLGPDGPTTWREHERVFAKLVHGDARHNAYDFRQAICSASLELGDSPSSDLVQKLYDSIDWSGVGDEADSTMTARGEGLLPGDALVPFKREVVVMKQNLFGDVEDIIQSNYMSLM